MCVCKRGTGVDDWSDPGMRGNVKWSLNGNWLVFRWGFPLVVRGGGMGASSVTAVMWQRQHTTYQQTFNQSTKYEHRKSRRISRDLRINKIFFFLEQKHLDTIIAISSCHYQRLGLCLKSILWIICNYLYLFKEMQFSYRFNFFILIIYVYCFLFIIVFDESYMLLPLYVLF